MNANRRSHRQTQAHVAGLQRKGHRVGAVLNIAVGVLAAGAIAWMGVISVTSSSKIKRTIPPDLGEMKVVLAHAGLDPKSMAAAGVTPQQAAAVASAARTYVTTNIDAIRAAESAYNHTQGEVQRLQRLAQSGEAQPEDLASYEAALAQLAASTSQRDTRLQALRSAATANLDERTTARIATIAGNHSWEVPTQYLTVSKAEPEWIALRRALANQRINSGQGQPVSAGAEQVLQTWGANADVAAAAGYLDTNLPGVINAWNQNLPSP